jgi:type 1 glutamine amidotransferase
VRPKKPRRLLVVDTNIGRQGHPSIPYANLAVELMGKKTGAFETVTSHDTSMLEPENLRQFDALYLNNTIGDLFDTPAKKDALLALLRGGGGLLANHAATITSPEWPEMAEILGAKGAMHREANEKVMIKIDDPANPLVAAFGGRSFEFVDEFFRFHEPYSREKVHVLLSIDVAHTDLNQGHCYGICTRPDNDYAIAWVRSYGKGRVFYTTLGHRKDDFFDSRILTLWLSAIQFALGDLEVNTKPSISR